MAIRVRINLSPRQRRTLSFGGMGAYIGALVPACFIGGLGLLDLAVGGLEAKRIGYSGLLY